MTRDLMCFQSESVSAPREPRYLDMRPSSHPCEEGVPVLDPASERWLDERARQGNGDSFAAPCALLEEWRRGAPDGQHKEAIAATRRHLDEMTRIGLLAEVQIPDPWVAMSEDGSIGCEWELSGRCLTVTFRIDGQAEFFGSSSDSEAELEDLVSGYDLIDAVYLGAWLTKGIRLQPIADE